MSVPETRGRSGRLPRSARRAQLMEAAQSVFVESGYHATAMDEIAERAQVSKPVLYQHFPGKLDLYLALLETHTSELPSLVQDALDSTTDNSERVAAAVGAFFDFVERKDAAFRMVFESDLINEPEVARRVLRASDKCAESVAAVVQEDTGLPHEQSKLIGVALVGMSQVVARYWIARGDDIPREEASRIVSTLGWRGLTGFPKQDESETPPA
ncbi:TetR family transcriptional regulator [Barrientosiimonas humi]|uniref:TetR family transcriptional regulator n=3 Tax=Dermacoccaceae TaxID=145357 RepID=A0A542X965_9MICO|nr:TetR family transcriptional regulator [Barrientosiimonas humi]BDZ57135.1 TetR family transcriptional regulator [Barrientosiimonas endolithica]CAG7572374.1 HTH-type transcriptional repressor KstR2 [Barrientosiimonas humi]